MVYSLSDRIIEKLDRKVYDVFPSPRSWLMPVGWILVASLLMGSYRFPGDLTFLFLWLLFIFSAWVFFRNLFRVISIWRYAWLLEKRIYELFGFKNFIINETRLIIILQNQAYYEFDWQDFLGYYIKGKTLFLVHKDLAFILKFQQEKTGQHHFDFLFSESIDQLERI